MTVQYEELTLILNEYKTQYTQVHRRESGEMNECIIFINLCIEWCLDRHCLISVFLG